jgi:electron transfer flavoprotein alpha subunit
MTALILAQHEQGILNPSTLAAVTAALTMSEQVEILVAGHEVRAVAEAASVIAGVAKVLVADAVHYKEFLAEEIAPLVVSVASGYSHIVTAATTTGKDMMPRIAALLDVQQVSDITAIMAPDTYQRPIYAGNALETVRSHDAIKVITIRPTSFDAAAPTGGTATIEAIKPAAPYGRTTLVSMQSAKSDRPELAAATIVVSGGRGVGSKENFTLIEALADKLGAAIGASRAAVDAGYVPNEYQVGQTGKVVAPALYIAVGISGAIQHLAGMKESKVIVAINKDENAPIFEVADYGLVGDLFDILPELTGKV